MRASLASACALLVLSLVAATAEAMLPPPARADFGQLQEVGRGRLTWLGFGIYDASLHTPDGRYTGLQSGRPVALSLWYQRKFTKAELIEITRNEWERLAAAPAPRRAAWVAALERQWVDVRKGDNLTAVVVPGGETRFYRQDRLLGTVADPAFGPAFLAIWLDPRTAVADLRAEMLRRPAADSAE